MHNRGGARATPEPLNPVAIRDLEEAAGGLDRVLRTLCDAFDKESDPGFPLSVATHAVTSVDWISSPSLRHTDAPAAIDIVLVNGDPNPNRADLPHYGAGETSCKPLIAAVANAVHDATGVRLRRVPFRDGRVLAALKAARV